MSRPSLPASAQPAPHQSLFGPEHQSPYEPSATSTPSLLTSAAIVKQEANLLRFPFFALGRKGLRNHKGLLIVGHSKLDNQSYDFEYRITCNSDDLYPGQLARKVHMGLLRIMQSKQPFPFCNPIEFTWRELMETIGILPGGRTVQQIIQKQLGKALGLVVDAGVLADAAWHRGKRDQVQLVARRGPLLAKRGSAAALAGEQNDVEATDIRELYRQARPEDELVCQFHALWDGNEQYHPTPTDRARAKTIVVAYGQQAAERLLPAVVELVRQHFPKGKSFGATTQYWPAAAAELDRKTKLVERRKQEFVAQQLHEERRRQTFGDHQRLQQLWDTLPATDQQAIRDRVLASHPSSMQLEKYTRTFHRFCLQELAKQNHS